MNRLLNGDVGSGKTAVAAACVAMAHAAGLQSVVMAPTEILARQHLGKFRAYLEDSFPGLTVELLVSGQSAAERRRVTDRRGLGPLRARGRHARADRGGRRVRAASASRWSTSSTASAPASASCCAPRAAGRPHFLAMTATPIPRTLALALYGEMAVSVIDELPPGRTPVETEVVEPDERTQAYDLVRDAGRAGAPGVRHLPADRRVGESVVARSATAEFERLQQDVFPDLRLGLVHGRLKDKDEVMQRIRRR